MMTLMKTNMPQLFLLLTAPFSIGVEVDVFFGFGFGVW
jgi:hypothetical protein